MFNKILKILAPVLILSFLTGIIIKNWSVVQNQITEANFFFLFLSLFILTLTHFGGAYFWQKILQNLSVGIPYKECLRVFIISNFGRFIPGIVLHYVARAYLSKNIGIGVKDSLASVFLEAYYTLAGAIVIGTFALSVLVRLFTQTLLKLSFSISEFELVLLALAILSLIFFLPPKNVFAAVVKIPFIGNKMPQISFRKNFSEHLWMIIVSSILFFLNGVAFYFLSAAFIQTPINRVFELSGLFASSWIVGFLTPVAPGGLGVSDLSFAYTLSSFYNFSLASFLAMVFRFGLLLSEGLVFIFVVKLSNFNLIKSSKGRVYET